MTPAPRRRAALVLSAALAVLPAGAEEPPGVSIAPARLERDLPGRAVSVRMLLVNHDDAPRRVRLSVAGLGHDLDGTPQFLEPARATSALEVSDGEFVLEPGERREPVVSGAIPRGQRSLYAGILAEFSPLEPPRGQVEARARVASLFLLRGPRPWVERVRVVDVGILPGERGRPLTVFAALRNTGNVHVRPTGRVRILRGSTLLDTVRLGAETVLPGYARRLVGSWTPPPGLGGALRLEAVLEDPPARGRGASILEGGASREPAAEIRGLAARDDDGGLVTLTLVNTGPVEIRPAVVLFAQRDGIERARIVLPQPATAPGESRPVTWRPDLPDGVYLVTAQATLGERLLDQAAVGLRVGAPGEGRSLPWVGLAVALLAAVALLLAVVRRRDGRAKKAERAHAGRGL